jgi:hypothetical protein
MAGARDRATARGSWHVRPSCLGEGSAGLTNIILNHMETVAFRLPLRPSDSIFKYMAFISK